MSDGKATAGAGKCVLDPAEWDFSKVPTEELPLCFVWEYARESAFIMNLMRGINDHPLLTPEGERIEKRINAYWEGKPCPKYGISAKWFDENMNPEAGKRFDALLNLSEISLPRGASRAAFKYLIEFGLYGNLLNKHWQSLASKDREKAILRQREIEGKPFECRKIRDITANKFTMHHNNFSFSFNWDLFTNKEIAECLREWVIANRPQSISEPRKNGDKTEDRRAWLKWLGVMRALQRFSFSSNRFPKELKHGGDSSKTYAMRTKAKAKFCELFGFLPGKNVPISYPTGRKSP